MGSVFMNLIFFVLFFSFQLISGSAYTNEHKIFYKDLQREVIEMVGREQDLRMRWINAIDSANEESLRAEVIQIDTLHLARLNEDLTLYPIEDEAHVNERRLTVGLTSIEEYLEVLREVYKNFY